MYLIVQIGQHPCNSYINCTTPPAPGVRNCTKYYFLSFSHHHLSLDCFNIETFKNVWKQPKRFREIFKDFKNGEKP